MNVIREDIDALNARLKVQVDPEDYKDQVKATLNKFRKTANMPGFRPGKVPFGLIQKQYGQSVLLEELNKVVNDSLQKYLTENKVEILGNPIPAEGVQVKGDFAKPEIFEFEYEIGLAPELNVSLSKKDSFDYLKVRVDDKLINDQISDFRRRYGKLISVEEVGDKDMIIAQFVELNDDESIKEGGILHSSTVSMEFVKDEEVVKELTGKKVGDKLIVSPYAVSRGGKDTSSMLGISEEELDSISDKFQLTVNEIKTMELAELNAELYDKLFGEGNVTNEEELRERMKKDLEGMFVNDSDRMLTRAVYENLLDETSVDLPNEFLKRWMKIVNQDGELSDEQIEADYEDYAKSLKWQLIQGSIFKSNDIQLDPQEAMQFAKGLLKSNYEQYGVPAPQDEQLTEHAIELLQKEKEANRIYDMLSERKLIELVKSTVKLKDKEISYDEFVELAQK